MNKLMEVFLDRLTERLMTLLAGLIGSRMEAFHSAAQADQQSQLEDLARQYEASGKPEIATTLRERAARLVSTNVVGEAVEIVERLTHEHDGSATTASSGDDLRRLPNFSTATRSRKRTKPADDLDPSGTGEAS
ncbi:MAG: hypothetical protein JNM18_07245 [Planctomycetaceae bacterium]|nr:hypothetical protein [Planctomycetaceae bacterium]